MWLRCDLETIEGKSASDLLLSSKYNLTPISPAGSLDPEDRKILDVLSAEGVSDEEILVRQEVAGVKIDFDLEAAVGIGEGDGAVELVVGTRTVEVDDRVGEGSSLDRDGRFVCDAAGVFLRGMDSILGRKLKSEAQRPSRFGDRRREVS